MAINQAFAGVAVADYESALLVDDLEDQVAELAERGLATGAIDTVPGVVRRAVITGPEGNTITFGEVLSADA